jgi:hypothetical protein
MSRYCHRQYSKTGALQTREVLGRAPCAPRPMGGLAGVIPFLLDPRHFAAAAAV